MDQGDLFGADGPRARLAKEKGLADRMEVEDRKKAVPKEGIAEPNTVEFPVTSGVAIPSSRESRQRVDWTKHRYPFGAMQVGDSFDVHPYGRVLIKVQNHVSGAASTYAKNNPGWSYTTRQIKGALVRCWRIA